MLHDFVSYQLSHLNLTENGPMMVWEIISLNLLIMFLFCKLNLSHFHLSAILKLVLTGRPLV